MSVKQITAYMENKPGTLYEYIKIISDAGINVRSLNIADTKEFGVLRLIVADYEKAKEVLEKETIVITTDVIAVEMSDEAGSLRDIIKVLAQASANIEYAYALTSPTKSGAYTVLRVDDLEGTEKALTENGYRLLTQEEIDHI